MWQNITQDDSEFDIRQKDDIEALLNSTRYKIGRTMLKLSDKPSLQLKRFRRKLKQLVAKMIPRFIKDSLKSWSVYPVVIQPKIRYSWENPVI